MDQETLLQQLLDACHGGRQGAMKLAQRTQAQPLKRLLEESARQYLRAADEIRTVWTNDAGHEVSTGRRARLNGVDDRDGDDIAASWERAECETLTYFRDAFDVTLPPPLAAAVKRHYEAGLSRLERLRRLRSARRRA